MDDLITGAGTQRFDLTDELRARMRAQLAVLYGPEQGATVLNRLQPLLAQFAARFPSGNSSVHLSAADAMLITYGDQIQEPGCPPLQTLSHWLTEHLAGVFSSVHILPFYPYTSDDGFSVVDYTVVDPALGDWTHVEHLSRHFKLMFDAVINHISASSAWFQGYLAGDPRYADYFIVIDDDVDLSMTTRPRTHPLLTTFETTTGPRRVWTTFSTDQIDVNIQNPDVLLALIDVLLTYVAHGAHYIRLDAIGYLWKTPGTRSIHLPETHATVQLFRSVLDAVAPQVVLITETNVPHADNISYFGDGHNEAQLVYQFPLAPLVLNAYQSGSSKHLRPWIATLATPSPSTTFFNFLASHDGIGVVPASGILSNEEVDALVQMTLAHGGLVSYKTNSDGSQSAYELNITLFDAISDPVNTPEAVAIDRFMGAQAIMLSLAGVPGVYIHSLFGSPNDPAGVAETGRSRTINRRKWQRAELDEQLADPGSRESIILRRYSELLRRRAVSPAFDPQGRQVVLAADDALFVLLRIAPDDGEAVVCVHNLSAEPHTLTLHLEEHLVWRPERLVDLLSTTAITTGPGGSAGVEAAPYQVLWLQGIRSQSHT